MRVFLGIPIFQMPKINASASFGSLGAEQHAAGGVSAVDGQHGLSGHVKSGHTLKSARVVDIAPTLSHLMQWSLPDPDGQVITDFFR